MRNIFKGFCQSNGTTASCFKHLLCGFYILVKMSMNEILEENETKQIAHSSFHRTAKIMNATHLMKWFGQIVHFRWCCCC